MKIGEKITKYRKELNLTQADLAKKLDISSKTVSKWENNTTEPSLDMIIKLCEVFKITTDEFINGKVIKKKVDNVVSNKNEDIEYKKKKAKVLCISIILYFVALIWLIVSEELFDLKDGILVSIFFAISAIPTCILVYFFTLYGNALVDKNETKEIEKNTSFKDSINDCITLFTLIIYLILSFATQAWGITWIIWIIYACVVSIINLLWSMKDEENKK